MAEIRLEKVTKTFNEKVIAVQDLDLHIQDGEFLVLLGPSGCGKTTTLRMIAGLERQSSGDIYIGERLVNELPAGQRDIAFVFQFYALYPHLSVKDNISFPLRAQKLPRHEVEARVQSVAQRLRIEHLLNKRPNRLPGGEQQRVALGRAMVRQPQVFLMDEPLTNLDASLRADMRVELKHLQHELATTMVYVTHDQVEAMSMSHRIAVMNLGLLQQIDSPLNIYNHPATLFVATFIGSPPMNIIPARLRDGWLEGVETPFRQRLTRPTSLENGRGLYVGVRAEDVQIQAAQGEDVPEAALPGRVLVREPLGDETIYVVDMGGYTLTAKAPPRLMLRPDDFVLLSPNPERLHLFDQASEKAVQ